MATENKEYSLREWRQQVDENGHKQEGTGKMLHWYPDDSKEDGRGQLAVEENFKEGKLDGRRYEWHENGSPKSIEEYKNGQKDGRCYQLDEKGNVLTAETHTISTDLPITDFQPESHIWSNRYYNDTATQSSILYDDGHVKVNMKFGLSAEEHLYVNGQEEGVQKSWYKNGQPHREYNRHDGHFTGSFKEYGEDGTLLKEQNYNAEGKKDGHQREWYADGSKRSHEVYENGVANGTFHQRYPNGQLKESTCYRNGEKEYISRAWHEDGTQAKQEFYEKGKPIGKWQEWYPSGNQKSSIDFTDGNHQLRTDWYENGNMKSVQTYNVANKMFVEQKYREDGSLARQSQERNGVADVTLWHANGKKAGSGVYVSLAAGDDKVWAKDGRHLEFYDNGALKKDENYAKGLKDGTQQEWHDNGRLKAEQHYKDGKLTGTSSTYSKDGHILTMENHNEPSIPQKYITAICDAVVSKLKESFPKVFADTQQAQQGKSLRPDVEPRLKEGDGWSRLLEGHLPNPTQEPVAQEQQEEQPQTLSPGELFEKASKQEDAGLFAGLKR